MRHAFSYLSSAALQTPRYLYLYLQLSRVYCACVCQCVSVSMTACEFAFLLRQAVCSAKCVRVSASGSTTANHMTRRVGKIAVQALDKANRNSKLS